MTIAARSWKLVRIDALVIVRGFGKRNENAGRPNAASSHTELPSAMTTRSRGGKCGGHIRLNMAPEHSDYGAVTLVSAAFENFCTSAKFTAPV